MEEKKQVRLGIWKNETKDGQTYLKLGFGRLDDNERQTLLDAIESGGSLTVWPNKYFEEGTRKPQYNGLLRNGEATEDRPRPAAAQADPF